MKHLFYSAKNNIKLSDGDSIPVADMDNGTYLRPFVELNADGTYSFFIGTISNLHHIHMECITSQSIGQNNDMDNAFNQLRIYIAENYGVSDQIISFVKAIEGYIVSKFKKHGD